MQSCTVTLNIKKVLIVLLGKCSQSRHENKSTFAYSKAANPRSPPKNVNNNLIPCKYGISQFHTRIIIVERICD